MKITKTLRNLGLAGIIAASTLTQPGCGNSQIRNSSPSYDNSTANVTENSLDKMLDSAFKIESHAVYLKDDGEMVTLGAIGTGFFVYEKDNKQYLATCYHVVDWPESLENPFTHEKINYVDSVNYIHKKDDTEERVNVIKKNPQADIAILETEKDLNLESMVEFPDKPLKEGDATYAVGFPLNIGKFITQGMITRIEPGANFFFTQAFLNPGNSGGPVFVLYNGKPYLAGMGRFYVIDTQGMFGAVKADYIKDTLYDALKNPDIQAKK